MKVTECKTIFARFEDIKQGKKADWEGEPISNVEQSLNRVGIALRKDKNTFRDFNEVLTELAKKWNTLNDLQRSDVTKSLAGTRQRESLMILLQNFHLVEEQQKAMENSMGSAQKKFDEAYGQSTEAKVNKLKQTLEQLYSVIFNSNAINSAVGFMTNLVQSLEYGISSGKGFTLTIIGLTAAMVGMIKYHKQVEVAFLATGTAVQWFTRLVGSQGLVSALSMAATGTKALGASMLAFFTNPVNLAILALGALTVAMVAHVRKQRELQAEMQNTKKSYDDFNNALKKGDIDNAGSKLDALKEQQKAIDELIKKRKELSSTPIDTTNQQFANEFGMPTQEGDLNEVEYQLREKIKLMKEYGLTVDENTGKIAELTNAEMKLKMAETGKSMSAEEIQKTIDARRQEIDEIVSMIDRFQELNAIQDKTSAQSNEHINLAYALADRYKELNVSLDENGKLRITNIGILDNVKRAILTEKDAVNQNIGAYRKWAEENTSIQIGMTNVTISEIKKRVEAFKKERDAYLRTLVDAQDAGMPLGDFKMPKIDTSYLDALNAYLDALKGRGSGGYKPPSSGGGSYTPPDADKPKKPKQEVQDLDLKIDKYYDLETAINDVNVALEQNRLAQEKAHGAKKTSLIQEEERLYNAQLRNIERLNQAYKNSAASLRSSLSREGFTFAGNGDITNYAAKLQQLQNAANSVGGDAKKKAQDRLNDINDSLKEYIDLIDKKLPDTNRTWQELANNIKRIHEEQVKLTADTQKEIIEVIKKRIDKEKEMIDKDRQDKIDGINKVREAYNKQNQSDDYEADLAKQQQKLMEIKNTINEAVGDLSTAGKARMQQLQTELANQQEVIDKMILERQRQLNNEKFDEEQRLIEEQAKKKKELLDQQFTPDKIIQMSIQAMSTGYFRDINGQMVELKDVYVAFMNEYNEGMTLAGEITKNQFLSQLEQVRAVMKDIKGYSSSIGLSGTPLTSGYTGFKDVGSNISSISKMVMDGFDTMADKFTKFFKPSQTINIDSPLVSINIEGNADSKTVEELRNMEDRIAKKAEEAVYDKMRTAYVMG